MVVGEARKTIGSNKSNSKRGLCHPSKDNKPVKQSDLRGKRVAQSPVLVCHLNGSEKEERNSERVHSVKLEQIGL